MGWGAHRLWTSEGLTGPGDQLPRRLPVLAQASAPSTSRTPCFSVLSWQRLPPEPARQGPFYDSARKVTRTVSGSQCVLKAQEYQAVGRLVPSRACPGSPGACAAVSWASSAPALGPSAGLTAAWPQHCPVPALSLPGAESLLPHGSPLTRGLSRLLPEQVQP